MQEGTELTKFEWRGRTGPFTLTLAPGVFTPTHTSLALAEVIEIRPGEVVADIGCGCGVLAFVAARLGAARDIFGPGNVDLLATRRFPLPSSAAREDILDDLVARGVARFERHGSRWLWTLRLWCCRRPA
jgi:Ribosomal protein L11 methyltransferase (PrmA)